MVARREPFYTMYMCYWVLNAAVKLTEVKSHGSNVRQVIMHKVHIWLVKILSLLVKLDETYTSAKAFVFSLLWVERCLSRWLFRCNIRLADWYTHTQTDCLTLLAHACTGFDNYNYLTDLLQPWTQWWRRHIIVRSTSVRQTTYIAGKNVGIIFWTRSLA